MAQIQALRARLDRNPKDLAALVGLGNMEFDARKVDMDIESALGSRTTPGEGRWGWLARLAAEAHGRNASLSGVEVRPSALSGVRNVVDVIFSLTNRNTDVTEKYFARVDVTEEFPFLVTKLSPFFDR